MPRPKPNPPLIDENGVRLDGRRWDQVRPVKLQVGVLKNADGSAYIEQGKTKVLAAVYGPKEFHPKHLALPDRAALRCRYHMAPFSTETRKAPAPTRREVEISKVIREALEPVVLSEQFPRTAIDVFIEVLQSDGGTRCAGITAASMALANAGIPLRDLVASCAVGKIGNWLLLDPNDLEDKYGDADLPVAHLPNLDELSLLQLNGVLSPEEFERALDMAIKACGQLHELEVQELKRKYAVETEPAGAT